MKKEDLPPHLLVGVTGNIGSGKSMFCKTLAELGVFRIDADQLARKMVEKGSKGLLAIQSHFGEECILPDGTLNRARLGQIVFASPEQRKTLEGILHPKIREAALDKCKEALAQGYRMIAYEAALLLEGNHSGFVDRVIVIYANRETRMNRVLERDGISREEVSARMDSQMNWEEQVAKSDLAIANEGSPSDIFKACETTMVTLEQWLKEKYS